MDKAQVTDAIKTLIDRIVKEKRAQPFEVDQSTLLLGDGSSIDSLDLATVVVELERLTGKDPFKGGFIEFETVEELAQLYVD